MPCARPSVSTGSPFHPRCQFFRNTTAPTYSARLFNSTSSLDGAAAASADGTVYAVNGCNRYGTHGSDARYGWGTSSPSRQPLSGLIVTASSPTRLWSARIFVGAFRSNSVTDRKLMSMAARRNIRLDWLRYARKVLRNQIEIVIRGRRCQIARATDGHRLLWRRRLHFMEDKQAT
jgi:hypothetical protein